MTVDEAMRAAIHEHFTGQMGADMADGLMTMLAPIDWTTLATKDDLAGHTARLDGIDHRLDGIDHRLDGIDHRLDGIDHRLDDIDHRLDGIDHRFDLVDLRMQELERRMVIRLESTENHVIGSIERRINQQTVAMIVGLGGTMLSFAALVLGLG